MDLWESCLIYAPVSGPCRSVRAPGKAKIRMGTGAAAAPSATSPPHWHPATAEVGLGPVCCVRVNFPCFLSPVQGMEVFLLCLFLLVFSKARPLGHRSQSVAMPCWGLTF